MAAHYTDRTGDSQQNLVAMQNKPPKPPRKKGARNPANSSDLRTAAPGKEQRKHYFNRYRTGR
jgi:hypothetical protein